MHSTTGNRRETWGITLARPARSATWHQGLSLPSASAIAAEYEVSARTVHGAVRVLVDEGLLTTEAGYGTLLA
jgi:DNA-binding GntR family transcriptional regulator